MGIPILIIGRSGSGKSASMRGMEEFGLINVIGKPLTFPQQTPIRAAVTDDYTAVGKILRSAKCPSVVIDDAGYLITNYFMTHHSSAGTGNGVFSLYNKLADQFWSLLRLISTELPPERIVYLMMQEDVDETGAAKPRTIGRLLDEKVCIEGMVSVLLRCVCENGVHKFLTNGDGIEKSPIGMFETAEIPNDLALVDAAVRAYWGLACSAGNEEVGNEAAQGNGLA